MKMTDVERALADELAQALQEAADQWGDESLWKKWGLSEALDKWKAHRANERKPS
jgi:hypothetical protein